MSENVTICPKCGSDMVVGAETEALPIQARVHECSECDHWAHVAIINWPDMTYDVISPALRSDQSCEQTVIDDGLQQCDADPVYRTQSVGSDPKGMCATCAPSYVHRAMEMAGEL